MKTGARKWSGLLLRWLAMALCSLILGTAIYLTNAKFTGNALPMPFGTGVAVVLSGSMEPELSYNDVIVVRSSDTYAVGDVVVYQNGNSLVVHQIISINGAKVTTKGTANNTADAPIEKTHILGKVVHSFDGLGAAVDMIRSPLVMLMLLAAAVALLSRSFRREKAEDDAQLLALKEEIQKLKEEIGEKPQ